MRLRPLPTRQRHHPVPPPPPGCPWVLSRSRCPAGWLAVEAVVEHQEGEPEDPEGMFGAQFVVLDDVELLGEAWRGQRRQLPGVGVDVGQVVASLAKVAPAAEHQATAGASMRYQR